MTTRKTLLALAIAASIAPLHSQAAEGETERVLPTVTATVDKEVDVQARTELGKLTEYTPLSGAVLKREEIEDLALVNNLLELGKRVPSISMVRNMRIPDGGKNYTENRVDGMRVSNTSNTSLLDEVDGTNLDRIEIITGPGSALYGSGALGGTINVFTRLPPDKLEAKLSQELGVWGLARTQVNVGSSNENGRFGFIFNTSFLSNDGWRVQPASSLAPDSAAEEKMGASLRTLFRPTDSTKLTLGLDRLNYDFRLASAIPFDAAEAAKLSNTSINGVSLRSVNWQDDWRKSTPGTYGQTINDYVTYTARLQHMVGEKGEIELAYSRRSNDALGYGAGGSGGTVSVICDDGTGGTTLASGKTVKCNQVNNGSTSVTNTVRVSNELADSTRLQYRQEFDWLKSTLYAGSELIDIRNESATYLNSFTALQAIDGNWTASSTFASRGQGSITTEKDVTPYVHFETSPTSRLRLHIGERFDRITYSVDDRTSSNADTRKTYSGAVTKSGLTFDLAKNHLLWASVAQTFNAPASSTLIASGTPTGSSYTPAANLDPEEGLTEEVGFRGTFEQLGLRYDVALYHSANKGFVVSRDCSATERSDLGVAVSTACTINENAGQLTAKGLESMFDWAATDWLDVGATYTNAFAYYDKYVTRTADYSGNSYAYMPQSRVNLRLGFKPAAGWKIELESDHISSYFIDTANSATYKRPDLYTLRASYKHKGWSSWLHVINLTDTHYATRVGYSTLAGVSNVKISNAGQGNSGTYLPFTVRAGVSYKF